MECSVGNPTRRRCSKSISTSSAIHSKTSELPIRAKTILRSMKSSWQISGRSCPRDNFLECTFFVANYMNEVESYDRVFEFLQEVIPYMSSPYGVSGSHKVDTENYVFILHEL